MTEELRNIKQLLASVKSINKRYAEVNKVREESGVYYNIFDVLKLSSSEVRLHSAILASLLRHERHGAGTSFLEAFLSLQVLGLPDGFLNPKQVQVKQELYAGPKTDKSGGRIDLVLTDGSNTIVIENKIYADDQENQLLRYHNKYPDARLVYLTLDGKDPAPKTLGTLDKESIVCLSYEKDIVHWLKECVKQAANLPYVRETINQYINTIQQLTNTYMPTNPEIVDLLSTEENIYNAFTILDNLNAAVNKVMDNFIVKLEQAIREKDLPFTCTTEKGGDWTRKYAYISFEHSEWKDVYLYTGFDSSDLRNFWVGIGLKDNSRIKDISQLTEPQKLASKLDWNRKTSAYLWEWASGPEPFVANWKNAKTMAALCDGSMVRCFIDLLERVIESSEGLDL